MPIFFNQFAERFTGSATTDAKHYGLSANPPICGTWTTKLEVAAMYLANDVIAESMVPPDAPWPLKRRQEVHANTPQHVSGWHPSGPASIAEPALLPRLPQLELENCGGAA